MQAHSNLTMFTSELSTGTASSFLRGIKFSQLVLQTGDAWLSFCRRRLFFCIKYEVTHWLQPRVRARETYAHNLDYVNYGVHIWYINKGKQLYVDWLPYVVFLSGKNGQKWPDPVPTPPRLPPP